MICPFCLSNNDSFENVSDVDKPDPIEGDLALCLYCAGVSVCTGEGFTVRLPTEDERDAFLASPHVIRAISLVMSYGEERSVNT